MCTRLDKMLQYVHMNSSVFNDWIDKEGIAIALIIIGAIVLYFFGSKLIGAVVYKIVQGQERGQPRKDIEKRQRTLASLATTVWRTLIIAAAVLSVFRVLFPAFNLAPLFAGAGIVGVAIAFGSQTLVRDFLTGLFIVTENQYRIGDIVLIGNAEGKVERVGTRSTVLRDLDGNVHYIPNGSIAHVINKTMGYSRVNFSLSLAVGSDLEEAVKLINATGEAMASDAKWKRMIIEPPSFDSIETFSKSAVEIRIIGKVQPSDQWRITAEMRRRLLKAFKAADIELA